MTPAQETKRRVWHVTTGLAAVWVLLLPQPWRLYGLLAALAAAGLLDGLRWPERTRRWLDRRLGGFYRQNETRRLSGATLLALGYLFAAWLATPQTAAAGILAAAIGDPAAAVAGRRGRTTGPSARAAAEGKTWRGSFACFAAVLIVSALLPWVSGVQAVSAAATAAVTERVSGRFDNLLLPVLVALAVDPRPLWGPAG